MLNFQHFGNSSSPSSILQKICFGAPVLSGEPAGVVRDDLFIVNTRHAHHCLTGQGFSLGRRILESSSIASAQSSIPTQPNQSHKRTPPRRGWSAYLHR
jgi:hypothetical protein